MCFAPPPICQVFALSFFIPFFIGIGLMIKYRKQRYIKIIGILSILIGVIVGFTNVVIIEKYWIFYEGFESRMFFIAAMIDFLFVPLFVFGSIYIKKRIETQKVWKSRAIILCVILISIIIFTVVGASMIKVTKIKHTYTYSIEITLNNTGKYYLYVPAPLNYNGTLSKIANDFEFVNGQGDFSVINTDYGIALNISSTKSVSLKVSGKADGYSFMDVSLRNHTSRDHFLLYCNKSFEDPITIEITAYDSGVGGGISFRLTGEIEKNGWNNMYGKFYHVVV